MPTKKKPARVLARSKKEPAWPAGEVEAARAARRTMTRADFDARYMQTMPIPAERPLFGEKAFAAWKKARADERKPPKPTIIHVNQNVIRSNFKHGRNDPTLTVRVGRHGQNAKRAHRVQIDGPSEVIHSMHAPLPCGARVWIETFAKVTTS